jgi:hypothetical protein
VYHCPARKPTTLLLIRLPKMVIHTMSLGARHPRGWHQALAGRDSSGVFHTAIAKVYQEALNNALAESIADFALKAGCRGQWVDPLLSLSLCRCCHLIMLTVPQYSLITMHRSMPNMTPALHDPSTTCSNRKGKKRYYLHKNIVLVNSSQRSSSLMLWHYLYSDPMLVRYTVLGRPEFPVVHREFMGLRRGLQRVSGGAHRSLSLGAVV